MNRGFTPELIDQISSGKFVSEILIVAPTRPDSHGAGAVLGSQPTPQSNNAKSEPWIYEMQELKVELGQQVLAGQTLCLLSNHQALAVEGRAFRDETPLLERSVRENWPVEVDFLEEGGTDWPPMNTNFHIAHLANNIDPVNRTFAFRIPLENQFRKVEVLNRVQLLWRFRPGQKVKVLIRTQKLDNVFVLPSDAVVREGPEAFVFTQNVNTFEKKPCILLHQDHRQVVIANNGLLLPGSFVVQSAAAHLNRMVKSGTTGLPKPKFRPLF